MKKALLFSILISAGQLTGCAATKGFIESLNKPAVLPEKTNTRIQFISLMYDSRIWVTPNSQVYDKNNESSGLVLKGFKPFTANSKPTNMPTQDLGMIKLSDRLDNVYNVLEKEKVLISEYYVNPDEPIYIRYYGLINTLSCSKGASFIPEKNTDYRVTGQYLSRCALDIEKFVTEADGTVKLVPVASIKPSS